MFKESPINQIVLQNYKKNLEKVARKDIFIQLDLETKCLNTLINICEQLDDCEKYEKVCNHLTKAIDNLSKCMGIKGLKVKEVNSSEEIEEAVQKDIEKQSK